MVWPNADNFIKLFVQYCKIGRKFTFVFAATVSHEFPLTRRGFNVTANDVAPPITNTQRIDENKEVTSKKKDEELCENL